MKIWSRDVLGPFWVAGAPRREKRRQTYDEVFDHFVFYARKCRPKGAFLEITKIENGTNIDQWWQDRHRDPLKTVPGAVLKNMKI
jgi:hypothetical protein